MPKPIAHSTLAAMLHTTKIDFKPLPSGLIDEMLTLTSGGVYPEGASLNGVTLEAIEPFAATKMVDSAMNGSAPQKPVGFRLGSSSRNQLNGVHPSLVSCVLQAIAISTQDFTVYDGIRTLKEQAQYVKNGTSKTMQSLHLPQSDGLGHAVDLVPWINGHAVWDWNGCYAIAAAMQQAATQLGIAHHIVWGGAWDRRLSDFGSTASDFKAATMDYGVRHAGPDFKDGPHFEWRD